MVFKVYNNPRTVIVRNGGHIVNTNPGSYTYTLPAGYKDIKITLVGGGGAGGIGGVFDGVFYSGGGGGASGACIQFPVMLSKSQKHTIEVYIGKGGDIPGEDGENSLITIRNNDETVYEAVISGGYGGGSGVENYGGLRGCINAYSGDSGESSLPSQPSPKGGNGGMSLFSNSGFGGLRHTQEPEHQGLNGMYGSGGGGSSPGTEIAGKGGNGFMELNW